METAVVDLRSDRAEGIRRAVTALQSGQLVALPTETVYGLAACLDLPEALAALVAAKARPANKPLTIGLAHPTAVPELIPGIDALGRRIVRRGLPGPLTLVFAGALASSPIRHLAPPAVKAVSADGSLGVRVPAHPETQEILHRVGRPVVLTSANLSGGADPATAQDALAHLNGVVHLALDDGATRYGRSSTVVLVGPDGWRVLREGVVAASMVQRLANVVILFVCTGNVCRSPMAAAMCRRMLADRLRCAPDKLEQHGYCILSAGVSAEWGGPATEFARTVAREHGAELGTHESEPLTQVLVEQSDLILAMTAQHVQRVLELSADAAERTHLLDVDGHDIADPMGHGLEEYRDAARRIGAGIEHVLATQVS